MKRLAILLLLCASLSAQTLTLVGPLTMRPGNTYGINVMLANPPADLAALQWSVALPAGYPASVWKCANGGASAAAAKDLYCNSAATTCLTVGINSNIYTAGVVAIYSLAVPAATTPGPIAIPLSGLVGATLAGDAASLTSGVLYNPVVLAPTDLNGDGKTDVQDLQIMIQRILEPGALATVQDAQIVARAALSVVSQVPDPRSFTIAFSARMDRCGLPDDQIALGPCGE